jgi:hypothetical protein
MARLECARPIATCVLSTIMLGFFRSSILSRDATISTSWGTGASSFDHPAQSAVASPKHLGGRSGPFHVPDRDTGSYWKSVQTGDLDQAAHWKPSLPFYIISCRGLHFVKGPDGRVAL